MWFCPKRARSFSFPKNTHHIYNANCLLIYWKYSFTNMERENEFTESLFDTDKLPTKSDDLIQENIKVQQILDNYNARALNSMVKEHNEKPVQVVKFNILGSEGKFRNSFLTKQLEPLIVELGDNKILTLFELLKKIDLSQLNLLKTEAVSNLGCEIVPVENAYNMFNPDLLHVGVNLHLLPVKKFFLKVGTNVGNGEGDGYIKLQWKNIFGGGESLDIDTNLSSSEFKMKSSKSQYLVNYSSPILNNANYKFSAILYHSLRNIDYTSFHSQSVEGMTIKLGTNHLPLEEKFNHELSIENLIRNIDIKNSGSDISYRNNSLVTDYFLFNAGHNFKSSITYSISKDTRDKKYVFDKGYYLRLSNEVSLFSKNKFLKSCFDYSKGYKLTNDVIFNLNVKAGILQPLENSLVHPMDKFQLGGPNDMKGWLVSGMGPKQMNMSIGGNYFHAIGLNVFSNVPFYRESNFKLHAFTNIGKLTNKPAEFLKNNSLSAGVGLSFAHPMAAFELNYVLPVYNEAHDHLRKGIQWGIGISFL